MKRLENPNLLENPNSQPRSSFVSSPPSPPPPRILEWVKTMVLAGGVVALFLLGKVGFDGVQVMQKGMENGLRVADELQKGMGNGLRVADELQKGIGNGLRVADEAVHVLQDAVQVMQKGVQVAKRGVHVGEEGLVIAERATKVVMHALSSGADSRPTLFGMHHSLSKPLPPL